MFITTDGYYAGTGNDVVYYKTDFLFTSGTWRGKFIVPYQHNARVLVIGHSDRELTDDMVQKLKHPGLERIFAVNATSTDPIVTPIPLGITNNTTETNVHPIYGN